MKQLTNQVNRLLHSNRGETLLESIVSMFILSIFVVTITTMLITAMRITNNSTVNAKAIQDVSINPMIVDETHFDEDDWIEDKIEFTFKVGVGGTEYIVEHDVMTYDHEGLKTFAPKRE
jgi:Tfp pilus assembly protein PilV